LERCVEEDSVEFDTGFFRFSVSKHGIILEDTINGRLYENFIHFVDEEDAGDEYTFSPLEKGRHFVFPIPAGEMMQIQTGPLYQSCTLRFSLAVPRGIDWSRRKREELLSDIPVELTFSVRKDSSVLELWIKILNTAENHRLRLVFDTKAETVIRGAHFCYELMEQEDLSDTSSWKEDPVSTDFFKDYVAGRNGSSGLQIITHDTSEFEVGNDGTLCFTLLRCVGDLSREDLLTRKGGAGFSFKTPDAQCKGEFCYRFGIAPFRLGTEAYELYRRADTFLSPPVTFPLNDPPGIIPGQILHPDIPDEFEIRRPLRAAVFSDPMTAFEIESKRIIVTSFQPLRGEDGYLLRLINYSEFQETSAIRFLHAFRSVVETTPDGKSLMDGDSITESNNVWLFAFRPFEMKTVKVLRS
jgi:alpha-mannosidase